MGRRLERGHRVFGHILVPDCGFARVCEHQLSGTLLRCVAQVSSTYPRSRRSITAESCHRAPPLGWLVHSDCWMCVGSGRNNVDELARRSSRTSAKGFALGRSPAGVRHHLQRRVHAMTRPERMDGFRGGRGRGRRTAPIVRSAMPALLASAVSPARSFEGSGEASPFRGDGQAAPCYVGIRRGSMDRSHDHQPEHEVAPAMPMKQSFVPSWSRAIGMLRLD